MNVSRSYLKKPLHYLLRGLFLLFFLILPLVVCGMALWYRAPAHVLAVILWTIFGLLIVWMLNKPSKWQKGAVIYLLALGIVGAWWVSIQPRSDRDWSPDVANIVLGEVGEHDVTLRNVRNFKWRTVDDYDVRWETRHYNLDDLESVDLFLSYWGLPGIAHTLVGFGFKGGDHIVFSVEIRKEKGEQFSNLAGFFKQYELSLIAADERDIIYLRTNVKDQDVYRYRINMSDKAKKDLFLSYLTEGQKFSAHPEFYNTITANCTTVVFRMVQAIIPGLSIDPRIVLSGWLPGYLYKIGGIDRTKPYDVVVSEARISAKAKAAGYVANFSSDIRK